jgi:hypothetical protein
MVENSIPRPSPADWSAALLTSSSETLLGAVRNYIGTVKTPYDKRDLVAKLEAFLRRQETRDSLFALLDPLDCKILGSSILVGSVPEQVLKELFIGEIPLFELGVRISNLLDRLLLFRYQLGGRRLIAVNPILEEELRKITLEPVVFFGMRSDPTGTDLSKTVETLPPAVDAQTAVALFLFLLHAPGSMRKGGGLTKRAFERVASLLPDSGENRLGSLSRALTASGVLPENEDEGRSPDQAAFARLLVEWGQALPYYLAACLSVEKGEQDLTQAQPVWVEPNYTGEGGDGGTAQAYAMILASALETLPRDAFIPRSALARWLRIVARRAHLAVEPSEAISALESLGIAVPKGEDRVLSLPVKLKTEGRAQSGSSPDEPMSAVSGRDAVKRPILVVEGAHALHLMPEASLEERLFVGSVARPLSFGVVWGFEVERDTVRHAFAAGLSAAGIISRFTAMAGTDLPQSFSFSLAAWEEEYRSLRLYRGFVLVADERQRPVIERSTALGKITAERLAPGVYFLSAVSAEAAEAALASAGFEAPPVILGNSGDRPLSRPLVDSESEPRIRGRIDALCDSVGLKCFDSPRGTDLGGTDLEPRGTDPEPRLAELRAALAMADRPEDARRELADRIERRLVLTERQIAQADPHPERLEASGLDYLGKVRVVERALRTSGDRLEVLYRLPGEEPVRVLLRPVRLEKNDKGLVLEAEDLGSGSPARVPLGAVSTVRRLRASLFGEDQ